MARTWLSVTVELLGGRGEELWPYPGRTFAVARTHIFVDLADAINAAFAPGPVTPVDVRPLRWPSGDRRGDRSRAVQLDRPTMASLDIESAKVARTTQPGAEFQFTFDLGDDWTHRCVVGEMKVDPVEVLGIRPLVPLPYWGWGSIPDQYGRRWADDDGEGRAPRRPSRPHPMRLHMWPGHQQVSDLDMDDLRAAIARRDAAGFLAALVGCDIDDALQQVGAGIPMALERAGQQAEPVAVSVINRLTSPGGEGDDVPERRLRIQRTGSGDGWRDLQASPSDNSTLPRWPSPVAGPTSQQSSLPGRHWQVSVSDS